MSENVLEAFVIQPQIVSNVIWFDFSPCGYGKRLAEDNHSAWSRALNALVWRWGFGLFLPKETPHFQSFVSQNVSALPNFCL